ncbi:MAG: AsmA-like C-terminal region-containing protein, partial [Terriglobales bacterium]
GEATVPDFRLKMAGNPVPLSTTFEVLVDGTNGNTILQPVHAKLGNTRFTTKGAVVKHEEKRNRLIDLKVAMPDGDLRDLLRLAAKGSPFMEGRISLNTTIDIPPLTGTVKEKLRLNGKFSVHDARLLRSNIQDQIDKLSRKGQGQPDNGEIDEVISRMSGSFQLENQRMTFRSLMFGVPGAHIQLAGDYDMGADTLDFHGTMRLLAKVSQTMTGWKRWALKPVDPFFEKNGAGTFLHIKVEGSPHKPDFGLDHGR